MACLSFFPPNQISKIAIVKLYLIEQVNMHLNSEMFLALCLLLIMLCLGVGTYDT